MRSAWENMSSRNRESFSNSLDSASFRSATRIGEPLLACKMMLLITQHSRLCNIQDIVLALMEWIK